MRKPLVLTSLILLVSVSLSAQMVDREAVAQRLVQQSAAVEEGDLVLITGGTRDLEMLENIAVHVRKAGAFPLISINSDRLARRSVIDVPAKYDSQMDEFFSLLSNTIDVLISIDSNEQEGILADVAPERLQARARANNPIGEILRLRGVRQVNLGNGMYPTSYLAQRWGMSRDELSNVFWRSVNADSSGLVASGERLRRMLAGGRELQITNPSGTNLRVRVEGRPVMVSDGTISAKSLQSGEKTQVWLPAGEVFLVPVSGTAEGKIVVPRQYFQGKPIENLTLSVKGGRVTGLTATSGIEPLRALWNAAGEGKDIVGVIDLGINPNVAVPKGMQMDSWVPAGMVTVQIGNNTWAGGDNNATFGLPAFLPGSTVTLDGRTIVENGVARF